MKNTPLIPDPREAAFGWVYLGLYTAVLPGALRYLNMLLPSPLSEAGVNLLFSLCNLISVVFIGWRFLSRSALLALRTPFRTLRTAGIGFVLYYCCSYLLGLLIRLFLPDFSNINDNAIAELSRDHYTLMTFSTVFLVPVTEEFLFRGLLFGQVYPRSRFGAYALSTAFFAAIHVVGYIGISAPGQLAVSFVQYIPAGLLLAWAYAHSGTIWAPILIHMTINQIGMQTVR